MSQADVFSLIDRLEAEGFLEAQSWRRVLEGRTEETAAYAAERASAVRDRVYGRRIFIRGLIEFTNYCRNDCYYCGIRRSNQKAARYRLTEEEILNCCQTGWDLGFRTFVLQGGEDSYFTDQRICSLIRAIKTRHPGCAVTLSIGEREEESYRRFREAGADRYLLRHETADDPHYRSLHPPGMSLEHRIGCLRQLKKLGYQTGAGMMVGTPGQTLDCLVKDMEFLHQLQPEMVGIGPFLPHDDTPFKNEKAGSVPMTLYLLSLVRLMLPGVLLPATTALGTASEEGRKAGILAGANVVMPNLSPDNVRGKYLLYNHKICTGKEAAENLRDLTDAAARIGFEIAIDRGDHKTIIDPA